MDFRKAVHLLDEIFMKSDKTKLYDLNRQIYVVIYKAFCLDVAQVLILELTLSSLHVKLANHYTNRGVPRQTYVRWNRIEHLLLF